ncbi:phytoene/squalene synthase family protein [bacterium]|nr:phytoene/squalene synthase family protein [bacterium]
MAAQQVWSIVSWRSRAAILAETVLSAADEQEAMQLVAESSRGVLRAYSTSFYLVTRFLPPHKRRQVELIYAAVRYPDELVDTFAPQGIDVETEMAAWRRDYERALGCSGLQQAVELGCNPYIAAFAQLVNHLGIPREYYRSFLDAMESDLQPRKFQTMEDLVERYIYGSATVVGYFLTYVYGSSGSGNFSAAMDCARELAIALQLTNFARDVADDRERGRIYIPLSMLPQSGWTDGIAAAELSDADLVQARIELAQHAQQGYARAQAGVASFSRDSRVAIECCINVYSLLNGMILDSEGRLDTRLSVSGARKFSVLPASKYWRVPLAMTGLL